MDLGFGWLEFVATRDAKHLRRWLVAAHSAHSGISFDCMDPLTGRGHRLRWRKIGLPGGYWLVLSARIGPADLPAHHAQIEIDLAPPAE